MKGCISTTSFAIMINGGPSTFFQASQGDMISERLEIHPEGETRKDQGTRRHETQSQEAGRVVRVYSASILRVASHSSPHVVCMRPKTRKRPQPRKHAQT